MAESKPYDHKPRPSFRFRRLRADCQDCMFSVGDSNGALVISQMEAHAANWDDHTVEVTAGEYLHPSDR